MCALIQAHVVADGDERLIEHCQVEIDEHMVSDQDVAAVVAVKGLVDVQFLSRPAEYGADASVKLGQVVRVEVIESPDLGAGLLQEFVEVRVLGCVHLATQHLLPLGHESGVVTIGDI